MASLYELNFHYTGGYDPEFDSLTRSYVNDCEIDFVRSFMWETTGAILDVGAYVGKMFYGLQPHFPNWEYVAVDPWEMFPTPLYEWWKPTSLEDDTSSPMNHSKYFATNCPYAKYHIECYENIIFPKDSFDIIIMSQCSKNINLYDHYVKAINEVKTDGIIIGRNFGTASESKGGGRSTYEQVTDIVTNLIEPENFEIEPQYKNMFAIW